MILISPEPFKPSEDAIFSLLMFYYDISISPSSPKECTLFILLFNPVQFLPFLYCHQIKELSK